MKEIEGCDVKKVIVMIDGGHLRALTKIAGGEYSPTLIEAFASKCITAEEDVLRVLYYDCAPFQGSLRLPISKESREYSPDAAWLDRLAEKDLFAVRLGQLKFRGFTVKPDSPEPSNLTDSDFKPNFMQKGVDMRIGLDIAAYSQSRSVERIVVVTADTDFVPALKLARKSGLQIVLIKIGANHLASELRRHADFVRSAEIPR